MERTEERLRPWKLMPAAPGTCPECAMLHDKDQPHNQQSVYYQYKFFNDEGRWPSWDDALAHCAPEVQAAWREELRKHRQKVRDD